MANTPSIAGTVRRPSRVVRQVTRQNAYSLIEILVALVLIAVTMLAVFRSLGVSTRTAEMAHARMLAQWSAENRLMEIRLRREWPNLGPDRFDCSQLNIVLSCVQHVHATPNPGFRRIELRVLDSGERQVARLIGFATLAR
mgnify:CR=1 FL=1